MLYVSGYPKPRRATETPNSEKSTSSEYFIGDKYFLDVLGCN